MMTFYLICLVVGVVFALLSFLFSGSFEAHVDAGVDVGTDVGTDVGHGTDITSGDTGLGDVHFPLFSPVVVACFVTAFGGGGIIGMRIFPFLPILSLPVALGVGLLVGFLVGLVLMKVYSALQTNAVAKVKNLIGTIAEVTEPISAAGVGQIMFTAKGFRISGPARCEENQDIKRHAAVTITRVVGGLYYVREHVDEKLRSIPTEPKSN